MSWNVYDSNKPHLFFFLRFAYPIGKILQPSGHVIRDEESMTSEASKFSCGACGRSYTWKKELAGRRGKCKCGQMMDIPASVAPPPPPEPQEDDLYSLADMVGMEKAAAA